MGQIATQSLWNNEFIYTKSESLYDESLVSKGIMTVSNLFNNEGELKNWETVSREFSLNSIHFLKWYGVFKYIPSCWKKTLKGYNTEGNILSEEESQRGIEANGKFIPLNSVTAKLVYKLHVSQKFSPSTSKKLLSNKFNIDDQNIWSSVYLLPASVTLDTKIRMFQHKILNNILYLIQRLYRMNLALERICDFQFMYIIWFLVVYLTYFMKPVKETTFSSKIH